MTQRPALSLVAVLFATGPEDGPGRAVVAEAGGRMLKRTEGRWFASFPTATGAIAAGRALAAAGGRVGVAVGDVAGTEDVHGTAVVVAARLCGAATDGQALVTAAACVVAGVGGRPVGALSLKGLPEPVEAVDCA